MKNRTKYIVFLLAALAAAGCSTTKRLGEGEVLYTGVKKMKVESMTGEKVPGDVESAVEEPLNVKPNNPLYSPYIRTPFPLGLWAYNGFYTEKDKGLKHWLYGKLAKEPVLVSSLQPELRMKLVANILDNHGYFGSTADYDVIPKSNPKKARMSYDIRVNAPWYYGSVEFPEEKGPITRMIRSLQPSSGIAPGAHYNIDSLTLERIRITNHLRENSYYYFRPEYLEYLADTTRQRHKVDLRMTMAEGIPSAALSPYKTGDVSVRLYSNSRRRNIESDSTEWNGIKIWYHKPLRIRPKILARALTIRPGEPIKVSTINSTLTNLTRLNIFRYVNMEVTPLDSLKGSRAVDMAISAAFETPMEAEIEMDFSSKSNSFIGPGAIFSVKHNNIFKGGEVLSVGLNGAYEWQTGNRSEDANSTTVNSYEFGISGSLSFPRLLLPKFIARDALYGGRSSLNLGATLMNRPKFFRMASFNLTPSFDFQTSPRSFHNLTLAKFVYNRMLSTTAEFDKTMAENPAIAQSFQNQFIPSASYTYTYDRGYRNGDRVIWQNTVSTAGNIFYGIYSLSGEKGTKTIFGNPFSQFVKGTSEVKHYFKLGRHAELATRLFVGAGHAYGNSDVMPYTEQFYIGGANSIRAFTVRSIGPGSYRAPEENQYGYFDQTGDFKLEANVELRFGIMGALKGAVFFDAGNIWLLEDDPARPGAKLTGKDFFKQVATGTGAGLRLDMSFLVLRLDMGIGIHTPYENPDKTGYYNIASFRDGLGFHIAIGYPF